MIPNQIRDCRVCALPTPHENFDLGIKGPTWVCSNCLAHWQPPKKPAVLYTCECCGERRLLYTQRREVVAQPVAECFRPDRQLVDEVGYLCAGCTPEEVARS
jgi:hypothetical protein